jgi:hypothetical protein
MATHRQITLAQYIAQRLGSEPEVGTLLKRMLVLSFGAASFREFWRFWNPVYGYFLYYYCYKLLRRVLPGPLSVLVTFFSSGFFLHDLPFGWWIRAMKTQSLPLPFVAPWFSLMGLLVLLTDVLNLNWRHRPFAVRVLLNGVCIGLAFFLAFCFQSIF